MTFLRTDSLTCCADNVNAGHGDVVLTVATHIRNGDLGAGGGVSEIVHHVLDEQ
jgi:hypothetical protein